MRPDAKSQVTIQYSDNNIPERIKTIVISTQHDDFDEESKMLSKIKSDVQDKVNHKFNADTILASVRNNKNIDKLTKLIKKKLSKKYSSNDNILITRERHRTKLNECLKEINKFLKKDQNKHLELAAEDLRMATRHLGGIVGKVDVEEILGSIFKDFCIGK